MLKPLLALSSVCLVGSTALAPELTFAPKEGATVKKTFTETSSWTVEEIIQTVMGQVQPMPDLDMETRSARSLTVLDTYGKTRAGRPATLTRKFDAASQVGSVEVTAEGLTEEYEIKLGTELAGAKVAFTWDADAERYTCASADDDAPDVDLDLLLEDLDLRAWLPTDSVEEGDSWDVDPGSLTTVFAPGGDLQLTLAGELDGKFQILEPADVVAAAGVALSTAPGRTTGDVSAKWSGTRKDGDTLLAEIELEIDVQLEVDAADAYARALSTTPGGDAREVGAYACSWAIEGDGTLLWDIGAGRFHSLELELTTEGELDIVFEVDGGGQMLDVQLEVSISGETQLSASAAAVGR